MRRPDPVDPASTSRRVGLAGVGLLAGWLAYAPSGAHEPARVDPTPQAETQVPAPGWGELSYAPPEPGSYELPVLGPAADGAVLDTDGRLRHLHDLFDGRVILLSFIYSSCSDANGCPLATAVLHGVFKTMQHDPQLGSSLRLLSLSFDPEHDTPPRLRHHAAALTGQSPTEQWQFLTAASETQLAPILAAYDQSVQAEIGPDGEPSGAFAHVLRVFLIDPQRRIRNIYSAAFLHRDLLLSDARTLLMENSRTAVASVPSDDEVSRLSGAGDFKAGYETQTYMTQSRSLQAWSRQQTDLLALAEDPPLGLPAVPVPSDNPLTTDKISLGRKLFYDRRLSLNDTFSCAMCHIPEQGFTSNEMATAVGIEGRTVRRNSPTLFNVAYAKRLFHDGRETTLEQQIWGPLLAPNEMGNPSVGAVLEKLQRLPDYTGRFESVFGRGPTMETLGMALAAYERTLLAAGSPFDRWYFDGQEHAISERAKHGFELFTGKAGCSACHQIGERHALFTDHQLHNTGIGYRRAMGDERERRRILVAPGTYLEVESDVIEAVSERAPSDLGLYELTQNPADRWKYKTPTLRNVTLTAPYMHDGSLSTLREVVEFYDRGGVPNENLSPLLQPLALSDREKDALVAFLESLTGSTVDLVVGDGRTADIGDLRRNDPHWSHATTLSPRHPH